ncbi:hypothetical protein NEOLEDRAFT_1243615 [Neolentinus lepideus HHB14362 ss-1]|uniref:Uncharacterized protein n=1 Tax=Neolentinus lepideus HHB14362 ss-1 TaxID=1314782 RepID=A0A165QSG9_9AGAM|nr:hypothetical protein NEOLEDRAFT_1243615 [Neolentinus lepideus HHB14362 ss-1]
MESAAENGIARPQTWQGGHPAQKSSPTDKRLLSDSAVTHQLRNREQERNARMAGRDSSRRTDSGSVVPLSNATDEEGALQLSPWSNDPIRFCTSPERLLGRMSPDGPLRRTNMRRIVRQAVADRDISNTEFLAKASMITEYGETLHSTSQWEDSSLITLMEPQSELSATESSLHSPPAMRHTIECEVPSTVRSLCTVFNGKDDPVDVCQAELDMPPSQESSNATNRGLRSVATV